MARVLIVGCGCRGRELARALGEEGHAVRGTSRDAANLPSIDAVGAEGIVADPDRLGTLLPLLAGVTVVCWLMGSADDPALHGERLESLLAKLVDSGVRGLVYEGTGPGAEMVRAAGVTYAMPVAVIEDARGWPATGREAVEAVLTA